MSLERLLKNRLRKIERALEVTPAILASEALVMLNEQLDRGMAGDSPMAPLDVDYAKRSKGGSTTPNMCLRGDLRSSLRIKTRRFGASIVFRSGAHHGGLSIQRLAQVQANTKGRDFMRLSRENKNRLVRRARREVFTKSSEGSERVTVTIPIRL